MPSKKKKGGRGKKAERQLAMAKRTEMIEALPPFPGPETAEQAMKRILGYKYLTAGNDKPISITRKGDNAFHVQEFSSDMQPEGSYEIEGLEGEWLNEEIRTMLPDYDRNKATFPAAMEIISSQGAAGMARRAKKRINDVPAEDLDVFLRFVEGGEGIEVDCGLFCPDLLSSKYYRISVNLTDDKRKRFDFCTGEGKLMMIFNNCFSECLESYQKDLSVFLMYESMVRVSNGTAEIEGEVCPDDLIDAMSEAVFRVCTDAKKYRDLVNLSAFRLKRAIDTQAPLHMAAGIECELGETLEARGFYSQAAVLYNEAGRHMYDAGHPLTGRMFRNTGIAWKRYGDYGQAEMSYALALNSMRFQYDPDEYRDEVFNILRSLTLIYYNPVKNFAPMQLIVTLQELVLAAGGEVPEKVTIFGNGPPVLREEFHNASKKQLCRVVQSVVTKSSSVQEMRRAILSCGNPDAAKNFIECTTPGDYERETKHRERTFLRESRGYIKGIHESNGFSATCSACGVVKSEKLLSRCSACKNEYYCNATCQASHWPVHRRKCKSNR